jgi:hypothetical protein
VPRICESSTALATPMDLPLMSTCSHRVFLVSLAGLSILTEACIRRVEVELKNRMDKPVHVIVQGKEHCTVTPGATCRFWYEPSLVLRHEGMVWSYDLRTEPAGGFRPFIESEGVLARVLRLAVDPDRQIRAIGGTAADGKQQPGGYPKRPAVSGG